MDLRLGLASGTQAKAVGRVRSMLAFLEAEGWIQSAPRRGAVRKGVRSHEERREAFTDRDLVAILTPAFRRDTHDAGKPAKYWLPLIALHTGARRGEIAQLHVGDVCKIDGMWALDLRAKGGGQTVKTESSRRMVPIHSQLIALGLLDHAADRRAPANALLFADVKHSPNGWGDAEGKWFMRWLREHAKIASPAKVFHSFRHTVSSRLKRDGVEEYMIARLLGHANESMTTGRYGGPIDPAALVPVVERLDFRSSLPALLEPARQPS